VADPVVIDCPAACTVTVQHEITLPVLNLSPAEGAAIASAILAVWAVAWAFRMLIQTVKTSDGNPTNED
jgi:hypothetical protein